MLPRVNMLATENSVRKIATIFAATALAILPACSPSGPGALLQGDDLLRKGKPLEAIKKLEYAKDSMPDEPRAWNLLGLAYHQAGQPQLAIQAYQHALAKDKSNLVAVAHYNLGCLYLEQTNAAAAADHLRSYTLRTNSVPGFLKLATAQLRLRKLEQAEASYGAALRLEPKNPEALNGVGIVHAQKNQRDAMQYFQAALQSDPQYVPAMLNAGLVAYQNPATRAIALRRFKDYLAAASPSDEADSVRSLVRQIESEQAASVAASNALAQSMLKSNALFAALHATNQLATTAPPRTLTLPVTNSKPPGVVATAKTNTPPTAKTNQIAVATNTLSPISNPPITIVSVANTPPPIAPPAPVTIERVTTAPPVVAREPTVATETTPTPFPTTTVPAGEEPRKRGFFSRLNPFGGKSKPPETNEAPRAVVLNTPTTAPAVASRPVFERYSYLSPPMPRSGNRREAERAMAQASQAERVGKTNDAWANYNTAIAADPSYFEAQYNTALLAYRLGDLRRALAGYEAALAIRPDSVDARYHLALALKQANYAPDAARELEQVIEARPNDARAHLMLGNLYAQQLDEPPKARAHYMKVLQLDPRNPQEAAIRFWLAANP
jgi:tetratricopeptide (TPR) repeat protein